MTDELAQSMIGQALTIRDFRGCAIGVDKRNKQVTTKNAAGSKFLLERAPRRYEDGNYNGIGLLVAFRLINDDNANGGNDNSQNGQSPLYLTINMYGDTVRTTISEAVANNTPLLPVHVPLIVDFLVDRPSGQENFEGAGFNYSPMTLAEPGASSSNCPSFLQVFRLVRCDGRGTKYGIKSIFGTFWRSEHWNGTISQSPHCLRDERWSFTSIHLASIRGHQHNLFHDGVGESEDT